MVYVSGTEASALSGRKVSPGDSIVLHCLQCSVALLVVNGSTLHYVNLMVVRGMTAS